MSDPNIRQPDPVEDVRRWAQITSRAQQLMLDFCTRQNAQGPTINPDPLGLFEIWSKAATAAASDPTRLLQQQMEFWQNGMQLWQAYLSGKPPEAPRDRRFSGPGWDENIAFDVLRQSYLLAAQHLVESVGGLENMDPQLRDKALFYVRQVVDAVSPSNFALTNPEVLRTAIESRGESLIKGLEHMLDDLSQGRLKQSDDQSFEIGRNLATTPGKVIYENRLFQLIQYTPTTEMVDETPLVIFPAWVNKYYILDLTPEKSFVRWAVEQGLTVFMVSWANPDSSYADVTMDDYVREAYLEAIERAREVTGARSVHTIGYCVGGTGLAVALGYFAGKGQADLVKTATFFTTMIDFSEAGELKLLIDNNLLETATKLSEEKGYLDGRHLALLFNLLRSNDLLWNYVVNHYLMGKPYTPFDLLYWNSDNTHVPHTWHTNFVRDFYRDNRLVQPGGITIDGVPIDLRKVKTPVYMQAGKEDHIAPAVTIYKGVHQFSGPVRFMLAGSGHIAGVVNPPSAKKYQYWISEGETMPATLEDFTAAAKEIKGSWWPDWIEWIRSHPDKQVPARIPGEGPLKMIEDAPGRYVRVRV